MRCTLKPWLSHQKMTRFRTFTALAVLMRCTLKPWLPKAQVAGGISARVGIEELLVSLTSLCRARVVLLCLALAQALGCCSHEGHLARLPQHLLGVPAHLRLRHPAARAPPVG